MLPYLLTTDNEKYILSGDYDHEEAAALLTAGQTVTLKWYQSNPLWGAAGRRGDDGREAHRPIR